MKEGEREKEGRKIVCKRIRRERSSSSKKKTMKSFSCHDGFMGRREREDETIQKQILILYFSRGGVFVRDYEII